MVRTFRRRSFLFGTKFESNDKFWEQNDFSYARDMSCDSIISFAEAVLTPSVRRSRLKRTLTRRWTSQIGVVEDVRPSTSTLEEGGAEANVVGEKFESATNIVQVQARTDMLEVPLPQSTFATQEVGSSRPSSAGRVSSKGSSHRNSGVMVEEEAPTWLQQYGTK